MGQHDVAELSTTLESDHPDAIRLQRQRDGLPAFNEDEPGGREAVKKLTKEWLLRKEEFERFRKMVETWTDHFAVCGGQKVSDIDKQHEIHESGLKLICRALLLFCWSYQLIIAKATSQGIELIWEYVIEHVC